MRGDSLGHGRCSSQWATLFLFVLLKVSASANNASTLKQKYPIQHANQENIRFSLFTNAPVTAFLEQNEIVRQEVTPMLGLLKGIVNGIDEERKSKGINKCNLREEIPNWVYTARLNSRYFQIGTLSTNCYTRIDGDDCIVSGTLSAEEVAEAPKTIRRGVEALHYAFTKVEDWPSRLGHKNWNQTYPLRGWRNQDLSEECTIETFSAYRVHGEMYVRAAMTNYDVDKYLKEGDRQYVMEWVKEDYSTSLIMVQPKYEQCTMENASTILWTRGGRAWLSWHGEMRESANPAIQKVIDANEVEIELAEDAVAAANIALLVAPLALTLIPIAFLAELNTCGFLWYVIFTDIISAVPLLIKGAELVRTTHSRSEIVSYYAGDEELADIQVWAANCSGTKHYRNIGITFIVIAITAIIGGMALELFATKHMEKKREEDNDSATVEGPFGKAMFDIVALGVLGTGHGANWERYSETLDVCQSDDEIDSTVGRHGETWKSWLLRVLSSASQVAYPGKQASFPPTLFGKRPSSNSELVFVAGVGKDGMSSAERAELGASFDKYIADAKT